MGLIEHSCTASFSFGLFVAWLFVAKKLGYDRFPWRHWDNWSRTRTVYPCDISKINRAFDDHAHGQRMRLEQFEEWRAEIGAKRCDSWICSLCLKFLGFLKSLERCLTSKYIKYIERKLYEKWKQQVLISRYPWLLWNANSHQKCRLCLLTPPPP